MEKSFQERAAEAMQEVPSVSAEEARQRKQNDPYLVFVDPRDRTEIRATTGIIPNALNITLYELKLASDGELPPALADRSIPIIAACQRGPMGALAAHELKQRGYRNVCFLEGGTEAWIGAGFPTIQ